MGIVAFRNVNDELSSPGVDWQRLQELPCLRVVNVMATSIDNFLDSFVIIAPGILRRKQYRRSLARVVMTIHMMRADRVIREEEMMYLTDIVSAKFDIDKASAYNLCTELCAESEHCPSVEELADYVRENSTMIERADCIREMWEIAVCDHELHKLEDSLAYRCAMMLDIDENEVTWLKELAIAARA